MCLDIYLISLSALEIHLVRIIMHEKYANIAFNQGFISSMPRELMILTLIGS
jgi:hypothetical protein